MVRGPAPLLRKGEDDVGRLGKLDVFRLTKNPPAVAFLKEIRVEDQGLLVSFEFFGVGFLVLRAADEDLAAAAPCGVDAAVDAADTHSVEKSMGYGKVNWLLGISQSITEPILLTP